MKFKLSNIFKGRISRRNFLFAEILLIAMVAPFLLFKLEEGSSFAFLSFYLLLLPLIVYPALALITRRLHDIGLSSQWQSGAIINPLFFIYLFSKKGEDGPNRWGNPVVDVGFVDAVLNLHFAESEIAGFAPTPPSGYEEIGSGYKIRKSVTVFFIISFVATIFLLFKSDEAGEILGFFNTFIIVSFLLLRISRLSISRESPLWAEIALAALSIIFLALAAWIVLGK